MAQGPLAFFLVLRATNGPGWEDPGAVYGKAGTPPVATYHGRGRLPGRVTSTASLAFLGGSMEVVEGASYLRPPRWVCHRPRRPG
jgi:hypothetical protein